MKVTLDRIEDNVAVLLVRDGEVIKFNLPVALLPEAAQEGDILEISITIDEKATDDAKTRVSNLMERLKQKNHGRSDIVQDPE